MRCKYTARWCVMSEKKLKGNNFKAVDEPDEDIEFLKQKFHCKTDLELFEFLRKRLTDKLGVQF